MESTPLLIASICTVSYLLGSMSSAIIFSRLGGMADPRSYGSHNPGATNVLRSGNKKVAALVLLGDVFKGFISVFIAQLLTSDQLIIATAGAFAFIGHIYPVFFKFKGGKGVATALGVLLGVHWALGLATLITWLLTLKLTRISSASALTASVLTPIYAWWLAGDEVFLLSLLLSALLIWRHQGNIRRLVSGQEK